MSSKIKIGDKFGKWTVVGDVYKNNYHKYYPCKCECGTEKNVEKYNLLNGKSLSCGCIRKYIISTKNTKDLTGQKFGRLIVISKDDNIKLDEVVWKCKCDCGNIVSIRGHSLRSGNTKSCGCLFDEYIKTIKSDKNKINNKKAYITNEELIGRTFSSLTVIAVSQKRDKNGSYFLKCSCKCGKILDVRKRSLLTGHTKSCGSSKCIERKNFYYKDLKNNRYGKLVAEKYLRNSKWLCKCDCGNEKIVLSSNLVKGLTKSCGCIVSQGEESVKNWLLENKINFIQQYTFDDCYYKRKLKFDFAIFNNNKLIMLIEFDGEQHFNPARYYKEEEKNIKNLEIIKKRDQIKNQYCIANNIKLLRINYLEINNLDKILSENVIVKN